MLNKVVGQTRAKKTLKLLTHGHKRRGFLPPVGVFGGSGLGKTHLMEAWADELGAELIYINGTAVKDAMAFRSFFEEAAQNQGKYYLMFIDECHGLPRKVQDNLLSVLEQPAVLCTVAPKDLGVVRCVDGRRYISKGDIIREELPSNTSFALATTDPAKLKDPVLNRLRKIQLEPYSMEDKIQIAMMHLVDNGVRASETLHRALADRSRSIRDLKTQLCDTFIDIKSLYNESEPDTLETLDDMLGIDHEGATDQDIDYLEYLTENPTVGVDTMAGKLGIDKQEVAKRIEPFLLLKGWIQITGRGRKLTQAGYKKVLGNDFTVTDE